MPVQLLPASAAAFAPRASQVNVVLGSKIEPWLTQTLKRVNRVKRPLNSVAQHQRCLTDLLSSPNAIWTLASLMLPKTPEADLRRDPDPLVASIHNYQLLHLEAYIVHVDMVLRSEVAFKLTPDSIEALVDYHAHVHCPDAKAATRDWPDKDNQCSKLHDDFVQAINRFVFRAHVSALEGLEDEGAGELLCGRSDEVKAAVVALMKPLLPPPPPPKPADPVRQPTLLPSSAVRLPSNMWTAPQHLMQHIPQPQHSHHHHQQHRHQHHQVPPAPVIVTTATMPSHSAATLPAPVESWRVLPSSPGLVSIASTPNVCAAETVTDSPLWSSIGITDLPHVSPTPAFSQPFSSSVSAASAAAAAAALFYGSPLVSAPLPQLPLPSMLAPQCGVGMYGGTGGFGWDRQLQEYATTM